MYTFDEERLMNTKAKLTHSRKSSARLRIKTKLKAGSRVQGLLVDVHSTGSSSGSSNEDF